MDENFFYVEYGECDSDQEKMEIFIYYPYYKNS